ncbi:MAG: hypothetical protein R2688_01305 [Fimbriimonadaceae bacterium]
MLRLTGCSSSARPATTRRIPQLITREYVPVVMYEDGIEPEETG